MIIKKWFNMLFKNNVPEEMTSSFPIFHNEKHYNDMSRRERREYKRWLDKNDMWDGVIVIENLEKLHVFDHDESIIIKSK